MLGCPKQLAKAPWARFGPCRDWRNRGLLLGAKEMAPVGLFWPVPALVPQGPVIGAVAQASWPRAARFGPCRHCCHRGPLLGPWPKPVGPGPRGPVLDCRYWRPSGRLLGLPPAGKSCDPSGIWHKSLTNCHKCSRNCHKFRRHRNKSLKDCHKSVRRFHKSSREYLRS